MAERNVAAENPGPSQQGVMFQILPQSTIGPENKEQIHWVSDSITPNQPLNQMRIVGLQNESLGNITLTQEQFSVLLANKSESGIVTLQLPTDDGMMSPMELQIVPEEQLYSSGNQKEVVVETTEGTIIRPAHPTTQLPQQPHHSHDSQQPHHSHDSQQPHHSNNSQQLHQPHPSHSSQPHSSQPHSSQPHSQQSQQPSHSLDSQQHQQNQEQQQDESSKFTPILQLPQSQLAILTNDHRPIKSLVFRQVKTSKSATSALNSLSDPNYGHFIRRKTYVDLSREDYLSKDSIYQPRQRRSAAVCAECNKAFTNSANLKRHVLNIHMGGSRREHNCEHCGRCYSRRDYLLQHIKTVHDEARYTCRRCSKGFTQLGSLTRHVESVHLKVRKYLCKHCHYKAASSHDLKKHAATRHFKQTRYECAVCKFPAWSAAVVKKHIEAMHGLTGEQRDRQTRRVNTRPQPLSAGQGRRGQSGNSSELVDVESPLEIECEDCEEMNPLGELVSLHEGAAEEGGAGGEEGSPSEYAAEEICEYLE